MHWFLDPIKNNYADFDGRTGRKAFWMFVLISFVISMLISAVERGLGTMFLGSLYSLAILLPSLAIGARRLHDIGKSGWWQLLGLIPIIGWIVLIVWMATEGSSEANEYGQALANESETADSAPSAHENTSPEVSTSPEGDSPTQNM